MPSECRNGSSTAPSSANRAAAFWPRVTAARNSSSSVLASFMVMAVRVMEIVGDPLDESEEAFAPWRDVCAMLDVIWGPETLRSGVVPLVEKRVESLQHESLVLFLDCLRHLILLRFTLPRLSVP